GGAGRDAKGAMAIGRARRGVRHVGGARWLIDSAGAKRRKGGSGRPAWMRRAFGQADVGVGRAGFRAALSWAAVALARLRLSLTLAAPRAAVTPSMVRPA